SRATTATPATPPLTAGAAAAGCAEPAIDRELAASAVRTGAMVLHQAAEATMRVDTLLVSVSVVLVGCNSSPAAAPPPRPPAEVSVVTLKTEPVTLQTELAGRTVASLASEVRPQVTGIIKARTFEEGALVKAGQALYEIHPALYRAA